MTTRQFPSASATRFQGHYAGVVTRFASFLIDAVVVLVLYAFGGLVVEYVLSVLLRRDVELSGAPVVSLVALVVWIFVYCAYPLAASGRTLGMAVLGVRAVRADGRDIDARQAVIRVIAFPLSFLLFGLGFVLIVVRRDRRALHDLIAHTAVVYAWDAHAARLRLLAKH